MKKSILILAFSLLSIVAAACGNNEVNGQGSADIPVEWVNAHIQKDQSKMLSLLDKKESALDPEDKADNKKTIENYKLTEWKASDDRYFYEIVYENPTKNNNLETEQMEVVKTDSGWKRTEYGEVYNFDKHVEDLEPKVLKELHN
ncbi:hypothetical protein D9C10_22605 (plasmid) [Bacillus subtilis subsp. subtilis]|uniref:hypothetical protein n=1 Tax=Bacillus subtilis TaxID=1423 RepID=UPI000C9F60F0|nr:hypothetical protein [Bacillus subtilis]AUS14699.1 hypothetical protein C0W65_22205 [Bacillus subtilis]AYK59826.1 hypothetical protein D9C10_22605 [Bacillus subtilis subsp. subtilis]